MAQTQLQHLTNVAQDYVAQAASMFQKGAAITSLLLEQLGFFEDNPLKFDMDEGNAPSVISCWFQDDIADCYVTKIWAGKDGKVYADLYAYYIAEDMECVCLNDDNNTDWADIIDYLIP